MGRAMRRESSFLFRFLTFGFRVVLLLLIADEGWKERSSAGHEIGRHGWMDGWIGKRLRGCLESDESKEETSQESSPVLAGHPSPDHSRLGLLEVIAGHLPAGRRTLFPVRCMGVRVGGWWTL